MNDNDFSLYQTDSFSTVVRAQWINPHISKTNTPVEKGGVVWAATRFSTSEVIEAVGKPFTINFSGGQESEVVHGASALRIIPVALSKPYSVVSTKTGQLALIKTPAYIKRDDLPENVSVSSAIVFFFVLEADTSNTLIALTFKSHLSNSMRNMWQAHCAKVANMGRSFFKVPFAVQAVGATLTHSDPRPVGTIQVGYVVDPILIADYGTADSFKAAIVPPDRFKTLKEYAQTAEVLNYPFSDPNITVPVFDNAAQAIYALTTSEEVAQIEAPSISSGVKVLNPGETPF